MAYSRSWADCLELHRGAVEPPLSDKWADRYDPADNRFWSVRARFSREDARRAIDAAERAAETWSAWPAPNAAAYFSIGSRGSTLIKMSLPAC